MEKKLVVYLGSPDPKKHSIRYNAAPGQDDPAITAIYIMKTGIMQIGSPKKIKITIEPAE